MDNKKKITLVEDDSVLRDILSQKLEKSGYLVDRMDDGNAAVERIREYKPDMILLDIMMPGKSGMQVLEELHADIELKKIPVIIISNSGQPIEISRAKELGARDFLIKAVFDPSEVLEKVRRIFATDAGVPYVAPRQQTDEQLDSFDTEAQVSVEEIKKAAEPHFVGEKTFILVVEDDKFLRELLVRKLDGEGFDVKNAINAEAAYEILKERTPKIILLDLILPGIDGFEILAHIKADSKTKDVPVLVLSNLGQKEDLEKAKTLGAKDFMVKANFTLDEILVKVRSIVG
ncbi:MAG: response regulator [Patescibacteria group bacterium]